jgi:hypothetical protein
MMKKYLLILLFATSAINATSLPFDTMLANKNWYKSQAQQWVNEYLLSVPPQNLCLIANVLYCAWARSSANVQTQRYVESSLQTMVDLAHHFDITRLTPARYFTNKQPDKTPLNQLYQALDQHEKASKAYHQAITLIVDKEALESINAQAAITTVRSNARTAVAQGVASVVTHFDQLLSQAHIWLESVIKLLFKNKPIDPSDSKTILQTLWKYIERLLAKAFIASDSKYITAWNDAMQALLIPHALHNALWDVMEQVRAAFYAAHYEAVYEYMQALHLSKPCYLTIDNTGFIANTTHIIPVPDSLLTPIALS